MFPSRTIRPDTDPPARIPGEVAGGSRHALDPLLRPTSVAIVGASAREDSLGNWCVRNLLRGGYRGTVYAVNPGYEEVLGHRCYASLGDLPGAPELVIFGVGDKRIEEALDETISCGVPAAVLMSALALDEDSETRLQARVREKIRDAGLLVCGANGMGFYNVRDRVWACGFDSREHDPPGNVSLVSHSGAGMCGILDCEERIRFNFAVSTGNELSVTMDQYLDFALDLPETRVVGLFIETARNPEGFRAALAKAEQKRIPLVAIKVGRSELSARLTVSHSGAIAGDDAAFEALFDRYGVTRVRDMDELATTLIMFAEMHPVGNGGLVSLHDSGGERQLLVDLADDAGVPLTELGQDTVAALEGILSPELPAVNPLDAWSRGGPDASDIMKRSLTLLLQDPGAAIAALVLDRAPNGRVYTAYLEYMQHAAAECDKPMALVAARQGTGSDEQVVTTTQAGFPVLDGVMTFVLGVRALFAYRDFLSRPQVEIVPLSGTLIAEWRDRLADGTVLDETESLTLLRDFGMPAIAQLLVHDEYELRIAAERTGYPLAMKTAMPGIHHKSDRQGVFLNLSDEAQAVEKYSLLSGNLGPRVALSPMADAGVEMLLGARRDPQFGPVILFGFGGTLAELTRDVVFALPPFDEHYARRRLDGLNFRPLLDGVRGAGPANVDAFCRMAAAFSRMVDALRDELQEFDVNPVIVSGSGCVAVDALAVGSANAARENADTEFPRRKYELGKKL